MANLRGNNITPGGQEKLCHMRKGGEQQMKHSTKVVLKQTWIVTVPTPVVQRVDKQCRGTSQRVAVELPEKEGVQAWQFSDNLPKGTNSVHHHNKFRVNALVCPKQTGEIGGAAFLGKPKSFGNLSAQPLEGCLRDKSGFRRVKGVGENAGQQEPGFPPDRAGQS